MHHAPAIAPNAGSPRNVVEDVAKVVGVVRRGWRLIVLGLLVSLTAAGFYLFRAKTYYQASTRLLVIQQGGRPVRVGASADPFEDAQGMSDALSTHLMIIKSPVIVEKALASAGLPSSVSVGSVLGKLTPKIPDSTARIIEISYAKAETAEEARLVIEGVVESYNAFLKDNYQKNTNEVISLIVKARDDLNQELKGLEKEYLKYRQGNSAYVADENGRTFLARRLDQWDQSMNQVLSRSLQLKSQLELGRRLSKEGVDPSSLVVAMNQLGAVGGSSPLATTNPAGTPASEANDSQSLAGVRQSLAEVRSQRETAEHLLSHLLHEQGNLSTRHLPSDKELQKAFYDLPEVADLLDQLRSARARMSANERLARSQTDPSLVAYRQQVKALQGEIDRLWAEQRSDLVAALTVESNGELTAAVRKAEADLITLRAKEFALGERLTTLARERSDRLRRERQALVKAHGEGHPQVAELDRQIESVENPAASDGSKGAQDATETLLTSIERSVESIERMREDFQKRFDEDLEATKKTEVARLEEANLRGNLERHQMLFNSVVDQLKQAQLISNYESVSSQTINPPAVSAERPNLVLVLIFATLAGIGIGTGAAFALDFFDARVRTLAEIRKVVDLPVIGIIPQLSSQQLGSARLVGLHSHETPRSALAESYKSARTNLEFLRRGRQAQVMMITSPHPGDGKSTTASNLAITIAHAGRRVLLVDADLRKPTLHGVYGVDRGHGFSDLLNGTGSSEPYRLSTLVANLDVMTAGSDVTNPAELLASQRLTDVIDELKSHYDIVIFDSSPLLAVTDPSVLASAVDALLLVVRIESTRFHDLERTLELVQTLGIPVLGLVVNGVTRSQMGFGYGYGYGYGYGGYGYGYGRRGGLDQAKVYGETDESSPSHAVEPTQAAAVAGPPNGNGTHLTNGRSHHGPHES